MLRHLWKGYSSAQRGSYSTRLLVPPLVVTNHPMMESNSSGSHAELARWAMAWDPEPDKLCGQRSASHQLITCLFINAGHFGYLTSLMLSNKSFYR